MQKRFWPIFSPVLEHDKCRGTIFEGPYSFLTIVVQLIRTFLMELKRSTETNISKFSRFHDDKCFWPIFPRIIECDKPQGRS